MRRLALFLQTPMAKTMAATLIIGMGVKMLGEVRQALLDDVNDARQELAELNTRILGARLVPPTYTPFLYEQRSEDGAVPVSDAEPAYAATTFED